MEQLFLLGLVGCTSVGAYLVGVQGFGRTRERFRAAIGQMLTCLGATLVFFGVNLGVGILVVLAGRALAVGFLSMYLSNDVSLLVLSAIQGLTFACWRES
jgi:hypothetical protein